MTVKIQECLFIKSGIWEDESSHCFKQFMTYNVSLYTLLWILDICIEFEIPFQENT